MAYLARANRFSRGPSHLADWLGTTRGTVSQTLKALERDGLISRKAYPTVPVTVEYALTPLGRKLTEAVAAFAHWAEANMDAIRKAQLAYDQRVG